MCVVALCFSVMGKTANATVFTAAVSGNFNAGLTWGGSAPGALVSTDIVIIPAGITVTLTSNEVFAGTSSLTVVGILNSMPGTVLSLTSGTLNGVGLSSADSMVLGLTSGFTYTGPILANKLTHIAVLDASNVKVCVFRKIISSVFSQGGTGLKFLLQV